MSTADSQNPSGIRSTGRIGSTAIPNHRWEDPQLDPYELRIAGWLTSHVTGWMENHVTRNMIAKRTGISPSKVSSSVRHLASLGIISVDTVTIRASEGGHRWVITIHLDVWDRPRSPDTPTLVASHSNPGRVATATIGSTVEVDSRENTLLIPSEVSRPVDRLFEQFWDAYPRRVGKKAAVAAWKKLNAEAMQVAVSVLPDHVAVWVAEGRGTATVPYPATWLNAEAWQDELSFANSSSNRDNGIGAIKRRLADQPRQPSPFALDTGATT